MKRNIILFIIFITITFILLKITKNYFSKENNINLKDYIIIKENNISYPKFNYKELDIKIEEFIKHYSNISFEVNYIDNIINIFFTINNKDYYNINYDYKKRKFISNNYFIDFNKKSLLNMFKDKYSTYIYNIIKKNNFKNSHIRIYNKSIYLYFDGSLFKDINYDVYILYKGEVNTFSNNDKIVMITFDDGPSIYTKEIVKTLIANNSKATFFFLGNRMKYNISKVKEIYSLGMEIGSHTYSHKNLVSLNKNEIIDEINSTNIIYNEITYSNIKYTRPPYGNYNKKVLNLINTPIILWDIDPLDWMTQDSEKTYKKIIENVHDGSIILMHDIYKETLEALKMILPVLNEMGYKMLTITEGAYIKNIKLENGKIYRNL